MKKVLKFCSVILLAVFVFSFWHSFVNAGDKEACQACCASDCIVSLKCDGDGSKCVLATNIETGQCKDPNKVTFCPISSKKAPKDLVNEVSKWMLVVALVGVPLFILLGAFYMLTAAGDPSRSAKGRTIIIWASIALAIFLFVKAFVSILRYILGF